MPTRIFLFAITFPASDSCRIKCCRWEIIAQSLLLANRSALWLITCRFLSREFYPISRCSAVHPHSSSSRSSPSPRATEINTRTTHLFVCLCPSRKVPRTSQPGVRLIGDAESNVRQLFFCSTHFSPLSKLIMLQREWSFTSSCWCHARWIDLERPELGTQYY